MKQSFLINQNLKNNKVKNLLIIATLLFTFNFINAQNVEENCYPASKKYLEENPDVAKAGMDAWSHYNRFGKREGRKWYGCDSDQKNIEINCDECKDIINLFIEAYNKSISFNSIDFFMMKGLVQHCYQSKLWWRRIGTDNVLDYMDKGQDCGAKMKEQFKIITGQTYGGPSRTGEGSKWMISGNSSLINIKLKSEIINNFKKEFDKELIEDCSDCKRNVNEYYEAWFNKQQIDQLEFEKKKSFVQKCQNQKATDCGRKMKKQLEILTGEATGDIVLSKFTNGYDGREDSKWRISDKASNIINLNTIFEDVNKLKNGSQIFKYKDLYGVMDQGGYVYIYPKYKSLQYAKFGNRDYLIVNNSYIIDFNQNEVIKDGIYDEIITEPSYNSFFIFKNSDEIGIVKYNEIAKTFNSKEVKLGYDDILFENNTCIYKIHNKYGFIRSNGDELKLNETNTDNELTIFNEVNFKKPYWYCKNDNLVRVFLSSTIGELTEVKKIRNVYNNIFNFDTFDVPNGKGNQIFFAKVQLKDKFGLINQNFEEVLAPQYEEVLKIKYDSSSKDAFVFVKEGSLYGSVNLDKSKKDNIYNLSANYASFEEIENQIIILKEQIKEEQRLAEENRLAEQRRIEEENRLAEQRRIEEEKRLVETNKITIDNIDIYYKDLGIFTYNDAVKKCNELGDGWRLPTSEELRKIADNIGSINNLNTDFKSYTKPAGNYNNYDFNGSNYWGKDFKFIILRKDVIGFGKVFDVMKGFSDLYYKSVRPVRINPEKEKIRIAEEKIASEEAWAMLQKKSRTNEKKQSNYNLGLSQEINKLVLQAFDISSEPHDAYQCRRCGVVSRSKKEPSGGEFGGSSGCSSGSKSDWHSWRPANTKRGFQCRICGTTSYFEREPSGGDFGGSSGCSSGSWHYWQKF
jgi:hypothetical protein